jgi:hypothetical protein
MKDDKHPKHLSFAPDIRLLFVRYTIAFVCAAEVGFFRIRVTSICETDSM